MNIMHTTILTNITRTLICCSHCLLFLFLRLAKLLAMVFCVDPFDCRGELINGKIFPPTPLPPPLVMSFLEEFLWRRECRPLAIEVMITIVRTGILASGVLTLMSLCVFTCNASVADPFDCSGGLDNGKIFPTTPLRPPLVMSSFLEEFLWRI